MVDWGKAAGGAGAGAAAGSVLGPWGTAGGAVVGGLLGLLSGGDDNPAPAPGPTQYGGNELTNQLAAQQYAAGLQQQQAQNAREAALYGNANANFDIANAAQLRDGPQIASSQSDIQRQLAALKGTQSAMGNVDQTGNQLSALGNQSSNQVTATGDRLTELGTRPMGPSYAEAQLRQGQDAAMAQQLSMARSGRSLGSGQAAMNQAMFNNAALNQQTNQAAASARIQEQNAYNQFQQSALGAAGQQYNSNNQFQANALAAAGQQYGASGALAGQAGGQATTIRQGNEGVQAQNAALNLQQQGVNNQTTGLYNQLGAQQQSLGMQANSQGQNAYQFGSQQASGALGAQLNADTGRLSSATATNIANQNNANAHDAANMNMASSGFGAAAEVVNQATADTPAVNPNNPSGSTSPYKPITDAGNRASDERQKTGITPMEKSKPPGLTSPKTDAKYAGFSPKDAAALYAADIASARGDETFTVNGKTQAVYPHGKDTPMDEDTRKIGVSDDGGIPAGSYATPYYSQVIGALDNGYRASQFAPADVLNRVPGAGAGPSAMQSAVMARMQRAPGSLAGGASHVLDVASQNHPSLSRGDASIPLGSAATSRIGTQGEAASNGAPLRSGPSVAFPGMPAAPAAAAPAWGDVFNAPQFDPAITAYLQGQPIQHAAPAAPTASPQFSTGGNDGFQGSAHSGTQFKNGIAIPSSNQQPNGGFTVRSDARSKTRIHELERQLAALSADAPYRDGETTRISAEQEPGFQGWLKRNGVRDLDNPDSHYDYRGAYLGGVGRGVDSGHFPDTYKQHGHPTFSNESQYSSNANDGGSWDGERFSPAVSPRAPDTASLDQAYAREQNAPAVDLRPARGYSYEYKDPNAPGAAPGRHVGPMAQDLEQTAAAGTVKDTPTGKVVDTPALTMVNTAALSEQQRKMQELERQLAALSGAQPAEYDPSLYPSTRSPY
jgi:hypothetical protein